MTNRIIMHQSTLWLCLFVVLAAQQVAASDQELRNVFSVINGGPLKPLTLTQKLITKDLDMLAKGLGEQYSPINHIEDIYMCLHETDRLIEKHIDYFRSGRVTKKRIDERNAIERAANLLKTLPEAAQSCELISYLDLMEIFKGAAGDSGLVGATDKVRSSIVAAIKLHKEHCSSTYYDRLVRAYGEMDSGVRDKVEKFFDSEMIELIFPGLSKHPMVLFEASDTSEILVKNSNLLFEKLLNHAGNIKEEEFLAEILPEQLVGPCMKFIEPLEGILLPAKLDMAVRDTRGDLSAIDPRLEQAVNTWARFHICSSVYYDEPAIHGALKREFAREFKS